MPDMVPKVFSKGRIVILDPSLKNQELNKKIIEKNTLEYYE
jgi:hypothetical protein